MTKDELSLKMFGRSSSLAFAAHQCVACGGSAEFFKDELSVKEYLISFLCQDCQNSVFGETVLQCRKSLTPTVERSSPHTDDQTPVL